MVVLWPLWLVSYRESRIVLSSSFESAISIQHVETRNISIKRFFALKIGFIEDLAVYPSTSAI